MVTSVWTLVYRAGAGPGLSTAGPGTGAGVTRWLLLTTLSALSVSPRVSPELSSQLQCQFLWTLATLATPAPAPVSVEHQRRPDQLVREHLDSQG